MKEDLSEKTHREPNVREADEEEGQDFDSVWQDYCKHTLITPASWLIYSVFYSILHLHKMLVFSRWGYNHNKLFADALGLHHRVKTEKKNQAVVGIKMKNHEMTLKKYNKDNKTPNKSYTPD